MIRFDNQHDISAAAQPREAVWRRRVCLGLVGAISVTALAACGSSSPAKPTTPSATSSAASAGERTSSVPSASSTTTSQPAAAAAVITIAKFAYSVPSSVSPGAVVTVLNKDGEAHTVTADAGSLFDDKASPGASTSFTAPMKPGSYPFHCTYHSNMHGVLVVK